jgi:hypothetical protein
MSSEKSKPPNTMVNWNHARPSGLTMGIADRTYYLDKDRQLTADPDKAAFVLVNKGQQIPKEMAAEYGIRNLTNGGKQNNADR